MPDTQTCNNCKNPFPLDHFLTKTDRPTIQCSRCRASRSRSYKKRRKEVPERAATKLAAAREWKRDNPERVKELKLEWCKNNKERIAATRKKYKAKKRAEKAAAAKDTGAFKMKYRFVNGSLVPRDSKEGQSDG